MIGGYANMTLKRKKWAVSLLLIFILMAVTVLMAAGISSATETNLSASGKVNSRDGAFVRARPTKASEKVTGLLNNKSVTIKGEVFVTDKKTKAGYKWYQVTSGRYAGYIRSDLIDTVKYNGTATGVVAKKVSYRLGAGDHMERVGIFDKGQELTVVLEAKAKDKSIWYKIRYGNKYYYVSSKKVNIKVEETLVQKIVRKVTDTVPIDEVVQPKSALKIAKRSAYWAKDIANDNTFHYGNGLHSHHNGCYFCGTQPTSKKKHVKQWQKTYCCNPFVTAAYAHGGNEPFMLDLCRRGKSYMAPEFRKCELFANLGHPAQADLVIGDVLCASGHVAIYIGNNKIAEACMSDDGKPGSSRWNNSITISSLTAKRYSGFRAGVFRYIGKPAETPAEPAN